MFKSSGSSNSPSTGSSGLKRTGSGSSHTHPLSLCADCGASGPSWASINRGVLLCGDCASVHRSLGRHVSHVKCLRPGPRGGGNWIPEQLTMVQSLYSCGANSIWEYSLLNPAASSSSSSKHHRKKPSAADPLHPVKSDFITAKYQHLSFVYRPAKDEPAVTESDLSRQLHSSVRTPNLETSLRLLSQGADPNYYHPEKNSTPLQVAAKAGQACQVELLLVYGADPGALDKMGRTAASYAKQSGNTPLASRISNAQYELSDRLSQFLCQKKPDHASGSHFLVPDLGEERTEERRLAKRKLQMLPNSVFEELAMDVYDEVDRRETDLVWTAVESGAASKKAVILPFLPVNPDYGTTRNQGRQKLARLNAKEFSILVLDVLKEIKRRQSDMDAQKLPSPLRETSQRQAAKLGQTKSLPVSKLLAGTGYEGIEDDPIYDHVASDDDYYHIPDSNDESSESATLPRRPHSSGPPSRQAHSVHSSPAKSSAGSSGQRRSSQVLPAIPQQPSLQPSEYKSLCEKLNNSEAKVQMLLESNDDMRSEISRLSVTVNKLLSENDHLMRLSATMSPTHSTYNTNNSLGGYANIGPAPSNGTSHYSDAHVPNSSGANTLSRASPSHAARAGSVSMYEPRRNSGSGPNSMPQPGSSYMTLQGNSGRGYTPTSSASGRAMGGSNALYYEPLEYEPPQGGSSSLPYSSGTSNHEYADPRELSVSGSGSRLGAGGSASTASTPSAGELPSQEEVVRRTEAITRCIQELLISAKDEKFDAFIPCSERIVRAVTDMVVLFPEEPLEDAAISASLSSLTAAATHFETECRILILRSQNEPLQQSFVTQAVIQCAFDIAKSTKQLVALFQ